MMENKLDYNELKEDIQLQNNLDYINKQNIENTINELKNIGRTNIVHFSKTEKHKIKLTMKIKNFFKKLFKTI